MATKKQLTDAQDVIASFLRTKNIKGGKEVTATSWKWEEGVPKYFKVLSDPVKRDKRPNEVKEPPFTCTVKNLEDGSNQTLILNTMLHNQLAKYEGELIGKCFVSVMGAVVAGKQYRPFDTVEVEDPNPNEE